MEGGGGGAGELGRAAHLLLVAHGNALLDVGEVVLRGEDGLPLPLVPHMARLATAAHRKRRLEYESLCTAHTTHDTRARARKLSE